MVGSPAGAPSSPSSGDTTQTQVDADAVLPAPAPALRPPGGTGTRAPLGTGLAHQAEPDAPVQEWMEGN